MYQFPKNYDDEENQTKPNSHHIEIFSLVDERLIYLYFIKEAGLLETHGKDISKLCLNMLSPPKNQLL